MYIVNTEPAYIRPNVLLIRRSLWIFRSGISHFARQDVTVWMAFNTCSIYRYIIKYVSLNGIPLHMYILNEHQWTNILLLALIKMNNIIFRFVHFCLPNWIVRSFFQHSCIHLAGSSLIRAEYFCLAHHFFFVCLLETKTSEQQINWISQPKQ